MREKILTDVDGVLLNWLDPFLEFMGSRKERKTGEQHMDFHKLENLFIDTTAYDIDIAIEEFNNSELFGLLNPIKKSEMNVTQLYNAGFEIYAITSSNTNTGSTIPRERNLRNIFGNIFEEIIFIPRLTSKKDILSKFPPSYWVEDFYKNAIDGYEVGHTPIMLKHSYNVKQQQSCTVHWADDWNDIFKMVM